jgi:hypothetical protein
LSIDEEASSSSMMRGTLAAQTGVTTSVWMSTMTASRASPRAVGSAAWRAAVVPPARARSSGYFSSRAVPKATT